ncbi:MULTISPECIES: zinc-binding dehydrogenase [unclassified Streptomyces]|uniref:zinc-binding dehydrogenase n=1 Tax=unclassified Streptomyces TaxID=2593676 RepID=UPI002DDA341F|nr:zinc-binding dehydrogenase [Streptomyces sp. NBC_01795]WSA93544.1 zinc-binding dehydrogenase [Streptomyces sp. NBC_01795]WSS42654.1 zinc-binding dehydrogenase [Streptomyces sp. NBC_01187]
MHAVVLHEFGPAENLRYETLPDPEPGPGQVRIAVRAAGVHAIETVLRAGVTEGLVPPLPQLPAVFGGEVSGTVDALGPGVDPGWLGRDVVTAYGTPGGYAELAVADVSALHPRPAALSHEAAVAMIVTGGTTMGVLAHAGLRPDDVVLINSAAGGIGRLLIQHARALGATVVGAAGGPVKSAAVRELGADLAVDYDQPGWDKTVSDRLARERVPKEGLAEERPGKERPGTRGSVTVVLDGVSGEKGRAAFGLLGEGGRYVTYGAISRSVFEPSAELLAERGVTWVNALGELLAGPENTPDYQAQALARAADGELAPDVQRFPLSRAAEAHAALERRETTGKVILLP